MSSTPPAGDDRGRTTDPWGNPLPQPAPVPPPAWGPPPGQPPSGASPDRWGPPGGQGVPAGGPPAPEGWGPPGAVPPAYGQPSGQPPVAPGQHPGYPPQAGYGPPPGAHPGYGMPGQGPAPSGWGWYQGPPQQDRQATTALVLAIASVLCAGLLGAVMGVIAIVLGVAARKRIAASNGRLTGGGLAVAAIAVATGGIILSIAFIVYLLANPNFLEQLTRPR